MDPSTLLNRPKTFNITPKITKINNLAIVSGQARKSSSKLVKVFEKGTYQKKTQLSVLNRYKKRLESIQKQNDRSFGRKRKVKLKLPDIKKYVGNFFTPGSANDPLKAIGALAAFTAFQKGSKGDWGGALGSGLVAAGLLGGGAAGIRMARSMFKGGATPASAGAGGAGVITPPWWMKNTKSLGRANESYGRYIAGEANIGDRARLARRGMIPASGMFSRGGTDVLAKQAGKPLAKEALGRFGKSIIPGIGAAFSFQSAKERDKAGDKFGSAVDNIAGSLDAFAAGVQLYAGASAATGLGLPVAGFIEIAAGIAEIGSFGLDMFNLVRDITGQSDKETQKNKLQQQTQQQKELVEKKKDVRGPLSFTKVLDRYEKVVDKFENFAKDFKGGLSKDALQVQASRTEALVKQQQLSGSPGYDFEGSVKQYLTGDPSSPDYDPGHGGSNYHDHVAFKDRQTAIRAYNFFKSKGFTVTEFSGFTPVGKHWGPDHYSGLAFDIPGAQWGGRGAIGQTEYGGSARVRSALNEFFNTSGKASSTESTPSATMNALNSPEAQSRFVQDKPKTPPKRQRMIEYYPTYTPNGYEPEQVIPYPVIRQPQMMQSSSESMMMPGPSEQELLNSFYKRVLLNTVS